MSESELVEKNTAYIPPKPVLLLDQIFDANKISQIVLNCKYIYDYDGNTSDCLCTTIYVIGSGINSCILNSHRLISRNRYPRYINFLGYKIKAGTKYESNDLFRERKYLLKSEIMSDLEDIVKNLNATWKAALQN